MMKNKYRESTVQQRV